MNVYKDNSVDTYYPNRAVELEDYCLVNILTRFAVLKDKVSAG